MDQLIAALKIFIEWVKEPYKAMIAVFIIFGLALFLPASLTDKMGIGELVRSHRGLEWGCFLFLLAYLMLVGVESVYIRIRILVHLRRLPTDERYALMSFMKNEKRTASIIAHTPAASALVRLGILEECDPKYKGSNKSPDNYSFTLKPWIYRHLKKHQNLLWQ
jgi:hypothetical protein